MKALLNATYRGAVEGGKKAFFRSVIDRWGYRLVELDAAVSCLVKPPAKWKKWLHEHIPNALFTDALLHEIDKQPVFHNWRGPLPAYGTVGNKVRSHRVCLDDRMDKGGEVIIPRMVRTRSGREVLYHQLIKERKAAVDAVVGDDDYCTVGAD